MRIVMVPGVGVEPTHPKVEVFETSASAIPPPGHSASRQFNGFTPWFSADQTDQTSIPEKRFIFSVSGLFVLYNRETARAGIRVAGAEECLQAYGV